MPLILILISSFFFLLAVERSKAKQGLACCYAAVFDTIYFVRSWLVWSGLGSVKGVCKGCLSVIICLTNSLGGFSRLASAMASLGAGPLLPNRSPVILDLKPTEDSDGVESILRGKELHVAETGESKDINDNIEVAEEMTTESRKQRVFSPIRKYMNRFLSSSSSREQEEPSLLKGSVKGQRTNDPPRPRRRILKTLRKGLNRLEASCADTLLSVFLMCVPEDSPAETAEYVSRKDRQMQVTEFEISVSSRRDPVLLNFPIIISSLRLLYLS